jgi:ABC-2 type transport system ATP-binding protein
MVIDAGRIIAEGRPDDLKRRISGDVVTLSVSGDPALARDLLARLPSVREITLDGRALRLSVEHGEEALPGMLRALDGGGITIESIQLARPTLDDVFLTLTGRSLRDDSRGASGPGPDAGSDPGAEPDAVLAEAGHG